MALRTPVGNGIDWKIGVFDTIIGYEVTDAGSNPNYTRSWGYAVEPTEHTGILGTYKINDEWSVSAGIANTLEAGINARAESYKSGNLQAYDWNKTFMGAVTFTAPSNWGWAAGSSFYAGIVYGFNNNMNWFPASGYYENGNQVNYYAGATLNTPWKQLTTGFAFDYVHNYLGGIEPGGTPAYANVTVFGLYGTFKATDKLSLNARGEYLWGEGNYAGNYAGGGDLMEFTGTVEYDMWANVIARLELRWDHILDKAGEGYTGEGSGLLSSSLGDTPIGSKYLSSVGLYANVIYKF